MGLEMIDAAGRGLADISAGGLVEAGKFARQRRLRALERFVGSSFVLRTERQRAAVMAELEGVKELRWIRAAVKKAKLVSTVTSSFKVRSDEVTVQDAKGNVLPPLLSFLSTHIGFRRHRTTGLPMVPSPVVVLPVVLT